MEAGPAADVGHVVAPVGTGCSLLCCPSSATDAVGKSRRPRTALALARAIVAPPRLRSSCMVFAAPLRGRPGPRCCYRSVGFKGACLPCRSLRARGLCGRGAAAFRGQASRCVSSNDRRNQVIGNPRAETGSKGLMSMGNSGLPFGGI